MAARPSLSRRILAFFVFASTAPVALLTLGSLWAVQSEGVRQADLRMARECRLTRAAIVENLAAAEGVLRLSSLVGLDHPLSIEGELPVTGLARCPGPALCDLYGKGSRSLLAGASPEIELRIGAGQPAPLALFDRRSGVLAAIDGRWFWGRISEMLGAGSSLAVVGADGRLLFASDPAIAAIARQPESSDPVVAGTAGTAPVTGRRLRTVRRTVFLAGRWGAPSWTLIYGEPGALLGGSARLVAWIAPLAVLFALLLTVLLSSMRIREEIEPLTVLERAIHDVIGSDAPAIVNVTTDDEIGRLGQAFNRLAREIRERDALARAQLDLARELLAARTEESLVAAGVRGLSNLVDGAPASLVLERAGTMTCTVQASAGPLAETILDRAAARQLGAVLGTVPRRSTPDALVSPLTRIFAGAGCSELLVLPLRAGMETSAWMLVGLPAGATSVRTLAAVEQATEDLGRALSAMNVACPS